MVGWIEVSSSRADSAGGSEAAVVVEHQLVALTYTGGWYRLSLPSKGASSATNNPSLPSLSSGVPVSSSPPKYPHPRTSSGSSVVSRPDKGKEREKHEKESRDCVLQEFRRFGRWDGW
jgi:hypothetical protein